MMTAPMAAPPVYLVAGGAAYYLENEDENVLFVAPIDNHGVPRWEDGGDIFRADGADPYIDVLVALLRAAAVTDRALVALY